MALKANGAGGGSPAAFAFQQKESECEHHEDRDCFCLAHGTLPDIAATHLTFFSHKMLYHVAINVEGK